MVVSIPTDRRDSILARLTAGQPVNSGVLASEFGVSEDAIRRDLRNLASEGLCRRVYGGALPVVKQSLPMALRTSDAPGAKLALANGAAAFLKSGSFIFLDNGSTNLAIVPMIPLGLNLTIATNSIAIAAALADRDDIEIVFIGSQINRVIGGAVDGVAIEAVSRMNIDMCFLGACALSAGGGASAFQMADAIFKRLLASRSRQSMVLVTNDKLGRDAPHCIVAVDAVDHLILEHDAPSKLVDELRFAGANICRAPPPMRRC